MNKKERNYVMNQELYNFKIKLLESGIFRHQTSNEYTCQCPNCGDNRKHCYVLIKLDDDNPVLYNCFKCNAKGIVGKSFLSFFGVDDIKIPNHKFSKKLEISDGPSDKLVTTSTVTEHDNIDEVCDYIHKRVGHYPTLTDLQYFQYIGNPGKYAKDYLGYDGRNRKQLNQRCWFKLTNGNIHGRAFNDDKIRWLRFKTNKVKQSGIYSIKLPFDLYQTVNVCITEGIMDAIGLYYNYPVDNAIYIATLGKDYARGIQHILSMGIFGESVCIRIFKDPDVNINSIFISNNLKKLFKRVDVYENLLGKDYGVPPEEIEISKIVVKNKR